MEISHNLKETPCLNSKQRISARHQLLFGDVAAGLSITKAAKLRNYSREHCCRLIRSPAGQQAIAQMRQEVEALLADNLTEFVTRALEIVHKELNSTFPDRRLAAARIVLQVARPIVESVVNAHDPDGDSGLVIEHDAPPRGQRKLDPTP